jgi:hypothetical protein
MIAGMPTRSLSLSELNEARLVFGEALDYGRVRISEGSYFPNFIADLGALLQGRKRTWDNAVTLGDVSYFPIPIRTSAPDVQGGYLRDIAWLIHELTHQWQYQQVGWRYLSEALSVQVRLGMGGYDYTGKHGRPLEALRAERDAGRRFLDFNREQQGDIARDYYVRLKGGDDVGAWEPFIADLKGSAGRRSKAEGAQQ